MPITAERPEDGISRFEEDEQEVQISNFPCISRDIVIDVWNSRTAIGHEYSAKLTNPSV